MADMGAGNSETGQRVPRTPWYRNANWLLLLAVIVIGAWMYHIFTRGRVPETTAAVPNKTAAPVTRVYPTPAAPARIVQFAHSAGDQGVGRPTDLSIALPRAPKAGDLLLALGSSGFGCVPSSGWTRVGKDSQGSTAVAYRVVQSGDGRNLVPFTTPRANSYTLSVIEIAGDRDLVSSPQAGGSYVPSTTLTNTLSLAIPQTGGLLLQLDAASGETKNGPPIALQNTLPAGQTETLVDRVPSHGWGSELIVRAVTSEARSAPQPFKIVEQASFRDRRLPGNIVVGRLIWIGGIPVAGRPSNP